MRKKAGGLILKRVQKEEVDGGRYNLHDAYVYSAMNPALIVSSTLEPTVQSVTNITLEIHY